jgi:hypothetical protein
MWDETHPLQRIGRRIHPLGWMNGAKAFASNIWRLERDQHLIFTPSEFDTEIVLDNQIRSGHKNPDPEIEPGMIQNRPE